MLYRLTFVAGMAVGYVIGARAGRERYEKLCRAGRRFAENPAVRNATDAASQSGREAASKAAGVVTDKVGDRLPDPIAERVRSMGSRQASRSDGWGTSGI